MTDKPNLRIPCEVYSRIVGYLRPLDRWNEAKRLEFDQRQTYKVPAMEVLNDRHRGS